jgi:hypothetical protein
VPEFYADVATAAPVIVTSVQTVESSRQDDGQTSSIATIAAPRARDAVIGRMLCHDAKAPVSASRTHRVHLAPTGA